MGLFLALSGVIGSEENQVNNALSSIAQNLSGGFELVEGTTGDSNIGVIISNGTNTTIMYPDGFVEWDDVSRALSETLAKPVFSLHIHDGDLWMFILFRDGKEIGWFNPVPEYWEELSPMEKEKWKGDASLIAELIPSVSPDAIENYFIEWNLEDEASTKAYPNDQYTICDCWQMCDFMKNIGLEFPVGDDGTILGDTFRLWTENFRLRNS